MPRFTFGSGLRALVPPPVPPDLAAPGCTMRRLRRAVVDFSRSVVFLASCFLLPKIPFFNLPYSCGRFAQRQAPQKTESM